MGFLSGLGNFASGAGQAAGEYGQQVRGFLQQNKGHALDFLKTEIESEQDPERRANLINQHQDIALNRRTLGKLMLNFNKTLQGKIKDANDLHQGVQGIVGLLPKPSQGQAPSPGPVPAGQVAGGGGNATGSPAPKYGDGIVGWPSYQSATPAPMTPAPVAPQSSISLPPPDKSGIVNMDELTSSPVGSQVYMGPGQGVMRVLQNGPGGGAAAAVPEQVDSSIKYEGDTVPPLPVAGLPVQKAADATEVVRPGDGSFHLSSVRPAISQQALAQLPVMGPDGLRYDRNSDTFYDKNGAVVMNGLVHKPQPRVVTMPPGVGIPANISGEGYHDPRTGLYYDKEGVATGVRDALNRSTDPTPTIEKLSREGPLPNTAAPSPQMLPVPAEAAPLPVAGPADLAEQEASAVAAHPAGLAPVGAPQQLAPINAPAAAQVAAQPPLAKRLNDLYIQVTGHGMQGATPAARKHMAPFEAALAQNDAEGERMQAMRRMDLNERQSWWNSVPEDQKSAMPPAQRFQYEAWAHSTAANPPQMSATMMKYQYSPRPKESKDIPDEHLVDFDGNKMDKVKIPFVTQVTDPMTKRIWYEPTTGPTGRGVGGGSLSAEEAQRQQANGQVFTSADGRVIDANTLPPDTRLKTIVNMVTGKVISSIDSLPQTATAVGNIVYGGNAYNRLGTAWGVKNTGHSSLPGQTRLTEGGMQYRGPSFTPLAPGAFFQVPHNLGLSPAQPLPAPAQPAAPPGVAVQSGSAAPATLPAPPQAAPLPRPGGKQGQWLPVTLQQKLLGDAKGLGEAVTQIFGSSEAPGIKSFDSLSYLADNPAARTRIGTAVRMLLADNAELGVGSKSDLQGWVLNGHGGSGALIPVSIGVSGGKSGSTTTASPQLLAEQNATLNKQLQNAMSALKTPDERAAVVAAIKAYEDAPALRRILGLGNASMATSAAIQKTMPIIGYNAFSKQEYDDKLYRLAQTAKNAMRGIPHDYFGGDIASRVDQFLSRPPLTPGAKGASSPSPAGKIQVKAPDGSVHPFDTQAQADAFKKLAGIK